MKDIITKNVKPASTTTKKSFGRQPAPTPVKKK